MTFLLWKKNSGGGEGYAVKDLTLGHTGVKSLEVLSQAVGSQAVAGSGVG